MICNKCKHLIIQNGYEPKCIKGGIPFYNGDCSLFENDQNIDNYRVAKPKVKKITNREWLNSLSNEDFVDWILGENDFDFNTKKPTPNAPHLQTILRSSTSSQDALLKWLDEEKKN